MGLGGVGLKWFVWGVGRDGWVCLHGWCVWRGGESGGVVSLEGRVWSGGPGGVGASGGVGPEVCLEWVLHPP